MKVKYPMAEALVVFCFNFPNYHEVIKWIADHQHQCSYEHLLNKWEHFADVYPSSEAWLRFYMDCGDEIREAMVDYIVQVFAPRCGNFDDEEVVAMDTSEY